MTSRLPGRPLVMPSMFTQSILLICFRVSTCKQACWVIILLREWIIFLRINIIYVVRSNGIITLNLFTWIFALSLKIVARINGYLAIAPRHRTKLIAHFACKKVIGLVNMFTGICDPPYGSSPSNWFHFLLSCLRAGD